MIETLALINLVNSTCDYSVANDHIWSRSNNDWHKRKTACRENLVKLCYNLNLVDDDELSPEELGIAAEEMAVKIGDICETYTR